MWKKITVFFADDENLDRILGILFRHYSEVQHLGYGRMGETIDRYNEAGLFNLLAEEYLHPALETCYNEDFDIAILDFKFVKPDGTLAFHGNSYVRGGPCCETIVSPLVPRTEGDFEGIGGGQGFLVALLAKFKDGKQRDTITYVYTGLPTERGSRIGIDFYSLDSRYISRAIPGVVLPPLRWIEKSELDPKLCDLINDCVRQKQKRLLEEEISRSSADAFLRNVDEVLWLTNMVISRDGVDGGKLSDLRSILDRDILNFAFEDKNGCSAWLFKYLFPYEFTGIQKSDWIERTSSENLLGVQEGLEELGGHLSTVRLGLEQVEYLPILYRFFALGPLSRLTHHEDISSITDLDRLQEELRKVYIRKNGGGQWQKTEFWQCVEYFRTYIKGIIHPDHLETLSLHFDKDDVDITTPEDQIGGVLHRASNMLSEIRSLGDASKLRKLRSYLEGFEQLQDKIKGKYRIDLLAYYRGLLDRNIHLDEDKLIEVNSKEATISHYLKSLEIYAPEQVKSEGLDELAKSLGGEGRYSKLIYYKGHNREGKRGRIRLILGDHEGIPSSLEAIFYKEGEAGVSLKKAREVLRGYCRFYAQSKYNGYYRFLDIYHKEPQEICGVDSSELQDNSTEFILDFILPIDEEAIS